jgi:hypothetical protein
MLRFARVLVPVALSVTILSTSRQARAESEASDPLGPTLSGPVDSESAPLDRDRVRLRIGFDAGGGTSVGRGATATGAFRLGVQASSLLSAYWQVAFTTVIGRDFGLFLFNSAVANLTLNDLVDVGFGPSLDLFASAGRSSRERPAALGLEGRLAFNIGRGAHRDGRRSAFTVDLHVHPVFADDGRGTSQTYTFYTLGLGGEWF